VAKRSGKLLHLLFLAVATAGCATRDTNWPRVATLHWEGYGRAGRWRKAVFFLDARYLGTGRAGFRRLLESVARMHPDSTLRIRWNGVALARYYARHYGNGSFIFRRSPYSHAQWNRLRRLAAERHVRLRRVGFWRQPAQVQRWLPSGPLVVPAGGRAAFIGALRQCWITIKRKVSARRCARLYPGSLRIPRRVLALALVAGNGRRRAQWELREVAAATRARSGFVDALRLALLISGDVNAQEKLLACNPPDRISGCGVEAYLFDFGLAGPKPGKYTPQDPLPLLVRAYDYAKNARAKAVDAAMVSRALRAFGAPVACRLSRPAAGAAAVNFCRRFLRRYHGRLCFNDRYFLNFVRSPTGRWRAHFVSNPLVLIAKR
jgi:hypothetical protein